MKERNRLTLTAGLATLGLIVALGTGAASVRTDVSAYVLVLAALLLAALTRIAGEPAARSQVSPFDESLRPRPNAPVRPPELVRVEREITLGTSSAGHLHSRLLPLLRDAAAARRGTFDESGLPVSDDRNAPGISMARLRRIIGEIEAL
jgi:hypothetical protein